MFSQNSCRFKPPRSCPNQLMPRKVTIVGFYETSNGKELHKLPFWNDFFVRYVCVAQSNGSSTSGIEFVAFVVSRHRHLHRKRSQSYVPPNWTRFNFVFFRHVGTHSSAHTGTHWSPWWMWRHGNADCCVLRAFWRLTGMLGVGVVDHCVDYCDLFGHWTWTVVESIETTTYGCVCVVELITSVLSRRIHSRILKYPRKHKGKKLFYAINRILFVRSLCAIIYSAGNTLYGFKMPRASKAVFNDRISATACGGLEKWM